MMTSLSVQYWQSGLGFPLSYHHSLPVVSEDLETLAGKSQFSNMSHDSDCRFSKNKDSNVSPIHRTPKNSPNHTQNYGISP